MIANATFSILAANGPREPRSPGHQPPKPLPGELLAWPVLVIEDEALIAWMVESLLEDLGFETIALAANAAEAWHSARAVSPGVIISDINLGAGLPDGIEAVERLGVAATVPVIFVTAHATRANVDRIEAAFPRHAIVAKPVGIEPLCLALHELAGPSLRN